MIRAIRNYWAFTKRSYRIGSMVLLPMVLLLPNLWFISKGLEDWVVLLMLVTHGVAIVEDVMLDQGLLSGFYRKGNASMEFLQTSNRFEVLMRDVVAVDMIRRAVMYVVPYLITMAALNDGDAFWNAVWYNLYCPVLALLVNQCAVFVGRHFIGMAQAYSASMVAYLAFYGLALLMQFLGARLANDVVEMMQYSSILWALLWAVVCVVTYVYTRKKVRESYYD